MAAILEMKHISKIFPGVKALDDVSYTLNKGEISALLGENGAGKSTLIKIISGVYTQTQGEILLNGSPVQINNPSDAQKLGIGTIHQEFNLFPNLTVLENIAFSSKLMEFSPRLINWKAVRRKVRSVLQSMNVEVPLDSKVKYLTVANQQLVEIAKALMLDVKVLIMDEPTAALTDLETSNLFTVIRTLKKQGVSIIYISHRMNEIMDLADSITVLRNGHMICSCSIREIDEKAIAQMITGKEAYLSIREKQRIKSDFGKVKLEVKDITWLPKYRDISFRVREGEIFGFLGPLGAGKTEIGTTLFGVLHPQKGTIEIDGKPVTITSPNDALKKHIAYISEDRKKTGILTNMSIKQNLTISYLMEHSRAGVINRREQKGITQEYIDVLGIKTPGQEQNINFLSGGNQQKVVIGRSLATKPEVLILDQPTRGLDIGAKDEIRKLLHQLSDDGISVIVLTMEVPEAMELCDTIAVLKKGRITEIVDPGKVTVDVLTDKMLSH
jgi:ribose transport system ATP-binding protein